jgi:hypothetical protein
MKVNPGSNITNKSFEPVIVVRLRQPCCRTADAILDMQAVDGRSNE